MSNKIPNVTDDELVLLADNELSVLERESLLARIESDNQWRRCALILLQSQALRRSLSGFAPCVEPNGTEADAKTTKLNGQRSKAADVKEDANRNGSTHAAFNLPEISSSKSSIDSQVILPAKTKNDSRPLASSYFGLTVVAAIMLLSGGLFGWFANSSLSSMAKSETRTSEEKQGTEQIAPKPSVGGSQSRDSELLAKIYTAVDSIGVEDSELVAFVNVENQSKTDIYPLIRSNQLSEQIRLTSSPQIPNRIASQIRRSGWQVQSAKHFVSINFPDGKIQTIPIGMLNYKFVGNPVF